MSTAPMASPTSSTKSQDPWIFSKIADRPFFQVAAGMALIGTAYAVYSFSIHAFSMMSGVFFPLVAEYFKGSASFWTLHSIQMIGQLVDRVIEYQFVVFCASYLILPAEEQEGIQRYLISAGKAAFTVLKFPGTAAFVIAGSFFRRCAKYLPNAAAGVRNLEKVTNKLWDEFAGVEMITPKGSPKSGSAVST